MDCMSPMSDPPIVYFCTRVEDFQREFDPVGGSEKRPCTECGKEVWVAPSTISLQASYGGLLVCSKCFDVVEKRFIEGSVEE
jgi:hypothetical protein